MISFIREFHLSFLLHATMVLQLVPGSDLMNSFAGERSHLKKYNFLLFFNEASLV